MFGTDAHKAYDMIANQGYVAVANSNIQGGSAVHFTGGGHYIAIVGAEDGKFKVIDPGNSFKDGTSCGGGCGKGCSNPEYTPDMMNKFGTVNGGGIRRWLMIKRK